jgi:DNA-binding HxlR family transcriptional regulator
MRSYDQYCPMTKALDLVGERWTLLIVRELLARGGSRYTDLRDGLPGIATNLLADRLRELEQAGLVWREAAPPPIATMLYHLTPRGEALRPVLHQLGIWGGPLLASAPDGDAFRSHWLGIPAEILLRDHAPDGSSVTIEVRTVGQPLVVEAVDGEIRTRIGNATDPDAVLSGPHRVILALFAGRFDLEAANARGLVVEGGLGAVRRLLPDVAPPAAASA